MTHHQTTSIICHSQSLCTEGFCVSSPRSLQLDNQGHKRREGLKPAQHHRRQFLPGSSEQTSVSASPCFVSTEHVRCRDVAAFQLSLTEAPCLPIKSSTAKLCQSSSQSERSDWVCERASVASRKPKMVTDSPISSTIQDHYKKFAIAPNRIPTTGRSTLHGYCRGLASCTSQSFCSMIPGVLQRLVLL